MSVPFKKKKKISTENRLPITLSLAVFRNTEKVFVNLDTQVEETNYLWLFVGFTAIGRMFARGTKAKNEYGQTHLHKRVYGFEALAQILTAHGIPIAPEKVESMVKEAITKQMESAIFVKKSDLIPCEPSAYVGKNDWLLVSSLVPNDVVYRNINKQLKELKSPLRVKSGLKTKMVESY